MTSEDSQSPIERKTLTVRTGYTPKEHLARVEEHVINEPLSSSSTRREVADDLMRMTSRTTDVLTHQMVSRKKSVRQKNERATKLVRGLANNETTKQRRKQVTDSKKTARTKVKAPRMELSPLTGYAIPHSSYPSQYYSTQTSEVVSPSAWLNTVPYSGLSIPQVMPMMDEGKKHNSKIKPGKQIKGRKQPEELKSNIKQQKNEIKTTAIKNQTNKRKKKEIVGEATKIKNSNKNSTQTRSLSRSKQKLTTKPTIEKIDWIDVTHQDPTPELIQDISAWSASLDDNADSYAKSIRDEHSPFETPLLIDEPPSLEAEWWTGLEFNLDSKPKKEELSQRESEITPPVVKEEEQLEPEDKNVKPVAKKSTRTRKTAFPLLGKKKKEQVSKKPKAGEKEILIQDSKETEAQIVSEEKDMKLVADLVGESETQDKEGNLSKRRRRSKFGLLRQNRTIIKAR